MGHESLQGSQLGLRSVNLLLGTWVCMTPSGPLDSGAGGRTKPSGAVAEITGS